MTHEHTISAIHMRRIAHPMFADKQARTLRREAPDRYTCGINGVHFALCQFRKFCHTSSLHPLDERHFCRISFAGRQSRPPSVSARTSLISRSNGFEKFFYELVVTPEVGKQPASVGKRGLSRASDAALNKRLHRFRFRQCGRHAINQKKASREPQKECATRTHLTIKNFSLLPMTHRLQTSLAFLLVWHCRRQGFQ